MKIPDPEIPEPEFDEFGDRIVRPIVLREFVEDGCKIEVLENLHEWNAYIKQLSRNRDAAMLESGEINKAGLIRKNDIFCGVDFSKIRIVAVGDRKYEDID
ncbi:hypothetical protein L3V16_21105 [Brucella ciceri]|uniref:hypothetical protein n=1 Tax=Brucella ciceri TaxID=391287 RepID=UPI001F12F126|nr:MULTISPECIES: hypothetical protein [Brucella]MCH6206326.1 hypothetical protein [Brucella ciceri]